MQVRTVFLSGFSLLARTEQVSRQRLIVPDKSSGSRHESTLLYHTRHCLNTEADFPLQWQFDFIFHLLKAVWKLVPLFQVQILFHANPRFTSSHCWVGRIRGLWDFPNQEVLDLFCENFELKIEEFYLFIVQFLSTRWSYWDTLEVWLSTAFLLVCSQRSNFISRHKTEDWHWRGLSGVNTLTFIFIASFKVFHSIKKIPCVAVLHVVEYILSIASK